MVEVSFTKEYIEEQARLALSQWGYDCTVEIESDQILCVTVHARQGVELDSQYFKFRFTATPELTRSPNSGRHRKNYYEWHEGLVKFSSEEFWLCRGGDIRGASSDSEKAHKMLYNAEHRQQRIESTRRHVEVHSEELAAYRKQYYCSHREERLAYAKEYRESHREEHAAYKKQYRESHREELAAHDKRYYESHREQAVAYAKAKREQLWTNGTEILPWSTLSNRGRKEGLHKADILAQGWHLVEQ